MSGLGRTVPINGINRHGMVQTDAAVNPGNSGGPLLSVDSGEVVGLVDLGTHQANGIAFAVSAQVAEPLLEAWQAAPQPVSPGACSNPSPPQPPNPSSPQTAVDRAVAKVRELGFTVADTSQYDPNRTLNVLVGVRTGSADGTAQQAFFFVNDSYVGTDTSDTSAGVSVAWQNDTTSALSYQLYSSSDPQCCPTGGSATVRFHWDGTKLTPLDPIPPSSYSDDHSRR